MSAYIFSEGSTKEFKQKFHAYLADVQSQGWGTTDDGHHGRFIKLNKFLNLLRPYWERHGIVYSCFHNVTPEGNVSCQHVWMDRDGPHSVATPWQAGAVVPKGATMVEDGGYRTFNARRTCLMAHGVWADDDYDGLTKAEWEELLERDRREYEGQPGNDAPVQPEWILDQDNKLYSVGEFASEKDSQRALYKLWQELFKASSDKKELAAKQEAVDTAWGTFVENMSGNKIGIESMRRVLNKVELTTPDQDDEENAS